MTADENEGHNTATTNQKAYIMFGNPVSEEWDCVTTFEICPYVMPDFTKVTVFDLQKKRGREVALPNGEIIDIDIIFDAERKHFTLEIMQGKKQLLLVLCDVMVTAIFYTLSRAAVNIQIAD